MKAYETLQKLSICTGCAACQNVCPTNAIKMDLEFMNGFKPSIDAKKCIDCGKCAQICPSIHCEKGYESNEVYAAWANNEIRTMSSSGGAFTLLAEWIISMGGCVYGAAWEEGFTVKHIKVADRKGLAKLRYSKYVQSDTSDIYRDVKKELDSKRMVLFVGTPCQIAALKKYVEDKNLYTIDLLCLNAPSQGIFQKYLEEEFGKEKLDKIIQREALTGWTQRTRFVYKDGTSRLTLPSNDSWWDAFLNGIVMRDACVSCKYSVETRQGDISLGDFWRIEKYNTTWRDDKGTSCILVNSDKGKYLFEQIRSSFIRLEKVEKDLVYYNGGYRRPSLDWKVRERFIKRIYDNSFEDSWAKAKKKKWDIGVVTFWAYCNYGSRLVSWSIYKVLNDMGYAALMIMAPINAPLYNETSFVLNDERFKSLQYDEEDLADIPLNIQDSIRFNDVCDCFCVPSDQNFNRSFYMRKSCKFSSLNWVRSNKGKIGYSISFGTSEFWGNEEERLEMKYFLKRFDAISVREKSAIDLMRKNFDIEADLVLDPLFLCDKKEYLKLVEMGKERVPKEPYLLTFILGHPQKDAELEEILLECKNQLDINKVISIPDPIFNRTSYEKCVEDVKVEEWLAYLKNAKYIVTNSFHAACLAILFHKPFVVRNDISRGEARLVSLLNVFKLTDRMLNKNEKTKAVEILQKSIDYEAVDKTINQMKKDSLAWLRMAVEQAKGKYRKEQSLDTYDVFFEQMLTMKNQIEILNDKLKEGKRMIKDKFELYQKPLCTEADIADPYTRRMTNNFDFMSKWFYINKNNGSVVEELRRRGYQKIAIYGAARIGQLLYDELSRSDKIEVVYIMDQSVKKLADREVYQGITDEPIDAVVVTAINYFADVKRKLHGYTRKDIISIEDVVSYLYDMIVEQEYYNEGQENS